MIESETRKQILELIEKRTNRSYLDEKRLDVFFEKCWELKEPRAFAKEN